MKVVSFKEHDDIINVLDVIAKRNSTTRSDVIRKAIRLYIENVSMTEDPKKIKIIR